VTDLFNSLNGDSLRASIRHCIERDGIDITIPEYRFLLVRLHGLHHVLYEDHAPTATQIARKAIERAPRVSVPSMYEARPCFDCGAIFDAATDKILAYKFKVSLGVLKGHEVVDGAISGDFKSLFS
jgi:hypothetical protein